MSSQSFVGSKSNDPKPEVVKGPEKCACGCGKPFSTAYHCTVPEAGTYKTKWFNSPECRRGWMGKNQKAIIF